jgi:hypothetical protein
MTPFDINPDNDAGHSIDQDDLIAFHLHELSSPQQRALHRVLRTNPTLQAESLAIASTLRAFPKHEAALPLDAAALDRHWQVLRESLPLHVPPVIAPRSFFPRWIFPTLAASALAAAAILFTLHHTNQTRTPALATNQPPSAPTSTSALTSPITPSATSTAQTSSSIRHTPFVNHTSPDSASTSLASTSIPTSPTNAYPQQPTTPPRSDTPAANTTLATNHPPQPLSAQTALTPTFTPISERPGHVRVHHDHTTEITFAALADLTPSKAFTSITDTGSTTLATPYAQTATPTAGELVSFHQQLRPWLGYRITGSHTSPTFEYTYNATPSGSAGISVPENVFELSGSYVVRGPRHRSVSTSAEAGAGILDFHPTNPNASLGVSNSVRSTAVFGVSADIALTKHFALHAGYRALLYKSPPAYLTENFTVPASGNLTFSNQPVIGLTYRFHESSE